MYNEKNMVEIIKKRRLRWAGHAVRSQNSLIRVMLEQNPVERRQLERSTFIWEDTVKKDIEALGGLNWKDLAMNRDG